MATYILLANFTDQGIRKVEDTPKRADAFKDMAKKCGATVKDVFWTLGEYDIVAVVEAPDDTSITALGLSSSALGNVRTQTLRAFTQADMKTIISKMVKRWVSWTPPTRAIPTRFRADRYLEDRAFVSRARSDDVIAARAHTRLGAGKITCKGESDFSRRWRAAHR
jgi:uncharacterized protein with GYD domain